MVLSAAVDTIGKIIMLRPLLVRLTTLTFAAIAVAGVAPATANADTSSADVTGFTTKNITISSQGCHYVPVTMHMTTDGDFSNEMIDTTTHIYRHGVER